jgi:integrase
MISRSRATAHFRPTPRATPAPDFSSWPDALAAFTDDLVARGYSGYTVRDYRADVDKLAGMLEVAPGEVARTDLQFLAARLADAGTHDRIRRRRLSAYARFLSFLDARRTNLRVVPEFLRGTLLSSAQDRLVVSLIALAGLRPIEVAELEGRDIRLRRGAIVSRAGWRIVPIHPRVADDFRVLNAECPLSAYRAVLSGWKGFALNGRTVHARFQKIAQDLGQPDARPEDLRREVAQELLRQGTPGGLVRAFLSKDRGRPIAPRQGRFVDLTCLYGRLVSIGLDAQAEAAS